MKRTLAVGPASLINLRDTVKLYESVGLDSESFEDTSRRIASFYSTVCVAVELIHKDISRLDSTYFISESMRQFFVNRESSEDPFFSHIEVISKSAHPKLYTLARKAVQADNLASYMAIKMHIAIYLTRIDEFASVAPEDVAAIDLLAGRWRQIKANTDDFEGIYSLIGDTRSQIRKTPQLFINGSDQALELSQIDHRYDQANGFMRRELVRPGSVKLSDAEDQIPAQKSATRSHEKMLRRIAFLRLSSATFDEDFHGMLLMTYASIPFFELDDSKDLIKDVGSLIKRWEHPGRTESERKEVVLGLQVIGKKYHQLFSKIDRIFLTNDPEEIDVYLSRNISPRVLAISRDTTDDFFAYLSVLGKAYRKARNRLFEDPSFGPAIELKTQVEKIAKESFKTSQILCRFIEKNLKGAELPVNTPTGVSRKLNDAIWTFVTEIQGNRSTMLGVMEFIRSSPEVVPELGVIVSCSSDGMALQLPQQIIHRNLALFEGIQITFDPLDISSDRSDLDDSNYLRDSESLSQRLKLLNVKELIFSTHVTELDYMINAPRVAKNGDITMHNGVTCAYGKLYRTYRELIETCSIIPKGIIESWYEPLSEGLISSPYPETSAPRRLNILTKKELETRELATAGVIESRVNREDANDFILLINERKMMTSSVKERSKPMEEDGRDSPCSEITSVSSVSGGRSRLGRTDSSDSFSTISSTLSKHTAQTNDRGLGVVACSCYACRYNYRPLAEALNGGQPLLEGSSTMSPLRHQNVRRNQQLQLTPGNAFEPADMDDSFLEETPEHEDYQCMERIRIVELYHSFTNQIRELDAQIVELGGVTKATNNKGGDKARPPKESSEIKELRKAQKNIRMLTTMLEALAETRGIRLTVSDNADAVSKRLFD